jgi:hypothetical protein
MEVLEAELVALESIYEGCLQVSDRPDCKLVAYHAPPLTLQFYISAEYPNAKPAHLIKQQGVPTSVLKSISRGASFYEAQVGGWALCLMNKAGCCAV